MPVRAALISSRWGVWGEGEGVGVGLWGVGVGWGVWEEGEGVGDGCI